MQSQPFIYNNIQPQPTIVPLPQAQAQAQALPVQPQQFTQASVIDSLNAVNQHIQQQQQQQQQQPQPEKKLGLSLVCIWLYELYINVVIDALYKRQSDGPILWFAGPPLNVIPDNKALHSMSYLDWKKNQQKHQQINEQVN
ncbi:hypothetical protein [Parasitella parasitica]|uniref:Uncharacterized protein n=1 Tax=Parasitella parasitica TaxID=35722 RepID=A0A0B7N820_9FUNG|nr:hypothetical protein [Parasitella parasitica]